MSVADGRAKGVTGGGARPPADAPVETAQPVQPDGGGMVLADGTIVTPRERAAQNERTLPPFNPPKRQPIPPVAPPTVAPRPAPVPPAAAPTATETLINEFFAEDAPPSLPGQLPLTPEIADPGMDEGEALPPLSAEDRLRMPAASDTDSPSRGLLPTILPPKGDKFEGIQRGGFGDLGEAMYFPLTGDELRELVLSLFDTLAAQIRNDLRFSLALSYPRVRAVVRIEVEGHAEDDNARFTIEKIAAPKEGEPGGTALEVARARADQVCFVVQALRQEFTPEGEVDTPPDQMRDDLQLPKLRKQILETPSGGQVMADVLVGSDLRALTR